MSEQQSESTEEEQKRHEAKQRAWKKYQKRQNRWFNSEFSDKHGDFVKKLIKRGIVRRFQEIGYLEGDGVSICRGGMTFINDELGIRDSFGMVIESGSVAIFIWVSLTLETWCVRSHIEALEKYRRHVDSQGHGSTKRFIGAVAGAVVTDDAATFAQKNGIFVIVQSGVTVEIVTPPEGFTVKEW
ncbi:MAG: hypothetical protein FWD31_01780 [Planctomycetaceae bacterium]|nr:hypothetical protein [Planctomycetaceae bacterium]